MRTKTLNSLYPNLLEDIKNCMTDPVADILQNFSLEKSEEHYDKRVKQWENGNYKQNPAVKKEEVSFDFSNLAGIVVSANQANNMYINLKKEDFNK